MELVTVIGCLGILSGILGPLGAGLLREGRRLQSERWQHADRIAWELRRAVAQGWNWSTRGESAVLQAGTLHLQSTTWGLLRADQPWVQGLHLRVEPHPLGGQALVLAGPEGLERRIRLPEMASP